VLAQPPKVLTVFEEESDQLNAEEDFSSSFQTPKNTPKRTPKRAQKRTSASDESVRGEFLKIAKQQADTLQV